MMALKDLLMDIFRLKIIIQEFFQNDQKVIYQSYIFTHE